MRQLEGTYTLVKKDAVDVGENTAASKFHFSERHYGLQLHKLDRRVRAALGNVGLRWLTGYGERPQRVIGWSVGTIAA